MDDLTETLREIRTFAARMWKHNDPGRPLPRASAGNCCSTSQLVTNLLNRREPGWITASGYYVFAMIKQQKRNDAWHCWSQHENGTIVDLTADQFDDKRIIITDDQDRRYVFRANWNESDAWVRYYDIWIDPTRKRRPTIRQIDRILGI